MRPERDRPKDAPFTTDDETSRGVTGSAGLGTKMFIGKWFALRFDMRDHVLQEALIGDQHLVNDVIVTLGADQEVEAAVVELARVEHAGHIWMDHPAQELELAHRPLGRVRIVSRRQQLERHGGAAARIDRAPDRAEPASTHTPLESEGSEPPGHGLRP